MIKVIEFIPTLGSGGAETLVKDYCLYLNKEEFEITVVVMAQYQNSANEKQLEGSDVNIVYLGEQKYGRDARLNKLQKLIRYFDRYVSFRKLIMELKPDVIHIHLHMGNYFRILPKSVLKNTQLIYTVHNVFDRYFATSVKHIKKYSEYKELNRLVHKYNMTLIALHDDMNAEIRKRFCTDNVTTIHNGINVDRFHKDQEAGKRIRQELDIAEDAFVIGNVGRFHEQKNHDLIVDIFNRVCESRDDARLILVGRGDEESRIRARVAKRGLSDKVHILHDRHDIPDIMNAMDVFLFPSKWEGLGIVLLEAQSVGLKCVVSDAIPRDAIVSDLVRVVSLSDSENSWVEGVLSFDKEIDDEVNRDSYVNLDSIKDVVYKVAELYKR